MIGPIPGTRPKGGPQYQPRARGNGMEHEAVRRKGLSDELVKDVVAIPDVLESRAEPPPVAEA
eukprot:2467683-Lingulodinium_polyedra.AAC.1